MDQKGDEFKAGRGAGPHDVHTNRPGAMPPGSPLATSVGHTPTRNQMVLFWASFMTLIAAGIGFSIRGAILGNWGSQFGFTQTELGGISGAGLWGFPITIIALSFIADRVGYRALMVLAFLLHLASAVVTLAATPVFNAYGKEGATMCLYWGSFIFALANGTCEAVINPLTATLFPRAKTHWLNILHAGWPGGLIIGALLGLSFNGLGYAGVPVRWEIQMGVFLIPTLIYGFMMFGRPFPRSEAAAAGVKFGAMLMEFASPILLFLMVIMAMVGFVELGTDSWISNITGRILQEKNYGLMLFVWTSSLMFTLRFYAGPIVHKISPLGLLFCSAVLGCLGLYLLGNVSGILLCVLAATIYGCGKTFFWPTMLGVVSERFPKGGALTLGLVGGVGMLSAGLLGSPGIGYMQDYFASNDLNSSASSAYTRYKTDEPKSFLGVFPAVAGLDQSKVGALNDNGAQIQTDVRALEQSGRKVADDKNLEKLQNWWESAKVDAPQDKDKVNDASLYGGKMALTYTSFVPATMALCYLILIIYFWTRGGYKAEVLLEHKANDEKFTGGVEGPAEM